MKKDNFINIIRHISPDNRFLYNIKYNNDYSLDTLAIHLMLPEGVWSPSIPLCHFPSAQMEAIQEMCCELIRRVISSE